MKYVVYLTHYKGDKLPPFYIGSSNKDNIQKGYNGSISSKKYKEIYLSEQKNNKDLFKTRILSYHKTRKEALEEELRLHKKHNVVKNPRYINEAYASVNGFFGRDTSGILNPMFGKNHSNKTKEIISSKTKNKLAVTNTLTNKIEYVTKDEWRSTKHLIAKSKGRKIKNTVNYSISQQGKNNTSAKRIDIFNNNDNIIYKCHGNFKKVCEEHNLPSSAFATSYRNKTKIKYGKYTIQMARKRGYLKYQGWYARLI